MDKIAFVNSYIEKCDDVISRKNVNEAKKLQTEIISTFDDEINNIRRELDNYSFSGLYSSGRTIDFIGDLVLLRQKLQNYSCNLKEEEKKQEHALDLARLSQPILTATAEANQEMTANINITISNVIESLDSIPEEQVTSAEKETIKDYLYSMEGISSTKNKDKLWDKAKELLKYLLDKSFDVAIAILPYIVKTLQSGI